MKKNTAPKGIKIKMSREEIAYQIFIAVVVGLLVLCCLIPFLYVVGMSFTSEGEMIQRNFFVIIPQKPILAAYEYLLKNKDFFSGMGIHRSEPGKYLWHSGVQALCGRYPDGYHGIRTAGRSERASEDDPYRNPPSETDSVRAGTVCSSCPLELLDGCNDLQFQKLRRMAGSVRNPKSASEEQQRGYHEKHQYLCKDDLREYEDGQRYPCGITDSVRIPLPSEIFRKGHVYGLCKGMSFPRKRELNGGLV